MLGTTDVHATLAEQLRVLSDPTRLRVLDLLMQGVQCNCELVGALDLAPNLISHHLGVLRRAGLVTATRDPHDGRWIYYAIDRAALDRLNAVLGAFLDPARIRPRQPQCGPGRIPSEEYREVRLRPRRTAPA